MRQRSSAEKLLAYYYFWGVMATLSFLLFSALLVYTSMARNVDMGMIFLVLVSGFLWIGVTAVSRHAYVSLKQHIGKEISLSEFILTQLIVFFFPLVYTTVKKEVEQFEKLKDKKNPGRS